MIAAGRRLEENRWFSELSVYASGAGRRRAIRGRAVREAEEVKRFVADHGSTLHWSPDRWCWLNPHWRPGRCCQSSPMSIPERRMDCWKEMWNCWAAKLID